MLQILLHSSKTMTAKTTRHAPLDTPLFEKEAVRLAKVLRKTSTVELAKIMQLSTPKATQVRQLYDSWSIDPAFVLPAIDAFRGDIYSGLQVAKWSPSDRAYAHKHLVILSGLYGALRACDGIAPYRLEMGYKLPNGESMYSFWGDKLARVVGPKTDLIVNLSAVEYTKAILPYTTKRVVAPKFMTMHPETGEPVFVTVHAKIARGAFARWLIQSRIDSPNDIPSFNDLGYSYNAATSTPEQPVFICETFQGIGLSVRLVDA